MQQKKKQVTFCGACVVHLGKLPFESIAYPSILMRCFVVIAISFQCGLLYRSSKRVHVKRRLRPLPSPYSRMSEHLADKMQDVVPILVVYIISEFLIPDIHVVSLSLPGDSRGPSHFNISHHVAPGGTLSSSYPWTAGSFKQTSSSR